MTQGATHELASFASQVTLGDVPREVIAKLKLLVLDQLGEEEMGFVVGESMDSCAYRRGAHKNRYGGLGPDHAFARKDRFTQSASVVPGSLAN